MAEIDYTYTGTLPWYHKPILKAFRYIVPVLRKHKIKFWLDWGTLLGAVRNGKMIPWDYDIDIGIFQNDIIKLADLTKDVQKDGFKFSIDRNRKFARKIRFFSMEFGFDFHIDIDPWNVYGDIAKAAFDEKKTYPMSELNNLGEIEFEGEMYPCPKNPEAALTRLIGEDWKVMKVLSGNYLYVKWHDPDNKDMLEEMAKHKGKSCG